MSELVKEPHVIFVEKSHIVYAVASHSDTLQTDAEREAGINLRVDAGVLRESADVLHRLSGEIHLRGGKLQAGDYHTHLETAQGIDPVHRTRRPPAQDAAAHPEAGGRCFIPSVPI